MYNYNNERDVSVLQGLTLTAINGMYVGSTEIYFTSACGRRFAMLHRQDCCEHVSIEEIWGDPDDLLNSTLSRSEESSNENMPILMDVDSYTWTFYRMTSGKGHVDIRWLGTSNGYYGEGVSFYEIDPVPQLTHDNDDD